MVWCFSSSYITTLMSDFMCIVLRPITWRQTAIHYLIEFLWQPNSFGGHGKNTWNNLIVVHFHGGGNGNDQKAAVDFALLETAFMHRLHNFIVARRQRRWRKKPESEWLFKYLKTHYRKHFYSLRHLILIFSNSLNVFPYINSVVRQLRSCLSSAKIQDIISDFPMKKLWFFL